MNLKEKLSILNMSGMIFALIGLFFLPFLPFIISAWGGVITEDGLYITALIYPLVMLLTAIWFALVYRNIKLK